jgi:hypothetical protein
MPAVVFGHPRYFDETSGTLFITPVAVFERVGGTI